MGRSVSRPRHAIAVCFEEFSNAVMHNRLLDIEVNEQVEHFLSTGEFIEDQLAFTLKRL